MQYSNEWQNRSSHGKNQQRLELQWQLGDITFNLVEGDIFEVPADAIVNSDQSDFRLGYIPATITGQIRQRYGSTVQLELDAQTEGKTLPPGTVLKTSGGGDYYCIYHAGFHHPYGWLGRDSEENDQIAYLKIIRECVRWILEDFSAAPGLDSVAFPLIGNGAVRSESAIIGLRIRS